MIQVQKSAGGPALLQTLGVPARQQLEAIFDADPAGCQGAGNKLLNVAATIYNDLRIKALLIAEQHEKCCYCEQLPLSAGPGDVEHFRPKNGFKQAKADRQLGKPGYYWLAYSWENLFFSCDTCNRSYKRNFFPLQNPASGRAQSHHQNTATEQPLLLDPARDQPEQHIGFRGPVAVGLTSRGRTTIAGCGLNRIRLLAKRRTHLGQIERDELLADLDLAKLQAAEVARLVSKYGSLIMLTRRIRQARLVCARAALAPAEYTGMVRANFPHLPRR